MKATSSKTGSLRKNVQVVKDHIDMYLDKMLWARNEKSYGYLIGVIAAYNNMVTGIRKPILEVPSEPDVWLDDLNDQIKRQQDNESKIIMPDAPKIIIP
jgi:hypothetical protein